VTVARILVVDDNRLFREGLKRSLSGRSLVVAAEAVSFVKALELLQTTGVSVDLLVGDPAPDLAREFAALHAILQEVPRIRAVILTERLTPECSELALKSGAVGVLTHDMSTEALKHALGLVLTGKHPIPSTVAPAPADGEEATWEILTTLSNIERSAAGPADSGPVAKPRALPSDGVTESRGDLLATLSGRESQILDCLVRGLPNKLIARQLDMAEATVKVHLKALLRKLNVQNRTQAAILAVRRELEPPGVMNAEPGSNAEIGLDGRADTRRNRVAIQPLPQRTHFRSETPRWASQSPPQRIAGR
jgi:two-component system nitrate/nitrite response regulator NarL